MLVFSLTTSNLTNQDSIVSNQDIKYANLIFIEHQKLSQDNILLTQQIENYKDLVTNLELTDSLRVQQISEYSTINQNYKQEINSLTNSIKQKDKSLLFWKIGGITLSASLLILLLVK